MRLIECTKDVAVRGRNGYFDLKEVEVSELSNSITRDVFGNFYIGFFSQRRGKSAPVSFYGSQEDLHRIFAEICHFISSPT